MNIIERERFEAWLFNQPRKRRFTYECRSGCLVACFLRETTRFNDAAIGPDFWSETICGVGHWFPAWLNPSYPGHLPIEQIKPLTIGNVQDEYIKLFGDPRPQPEPALECERA